MIEGLGSKLSSIGAIFDLGGVQPEQLVKLKSALESIPHDKCSIWQSDTIALVASVQHTTFESCQTVQPYVRRDSSVVGVFDGYLLNNQELATDLAERGIQLRTQSDIEIALGAYEVWGEEFASRLEGEFAIIIADPRSNQLVVARDHMGFVPLYYLREGGRLLVTSDLRTIVDLSSKPLDADPLYLAQAMTNLWYLKEATPLRGVQRVVRAHALTFNGSQITTQRYWTPPTAVTIRYKRDEDYVEHYREVLFESVKRASRSHRPIGIAVSGGLDSSALYCVADQLDQTDQLLAPGLKGYSLAAEKGGNAYELPYARAVASHVGRELIEEPLFDPDIDWYTSDAAWHQDLPIPSNGAMMLSMERRVVADGSRVLINGIGGDEWLQGGFQQYREYVTERNLSDLFEALRMDGAEFGWSTAIKQSLRQIGGAMLPNDMRRVIRKRLRDSRRRKNIALHWLVPELRAAMTEAEEAYEAGLPEDAVEWSKTNLATSPFSDLSHSMMRRQRARIGLESRHPMLSKRFMEFSLQTPADIKRRGRLTKFVHREAMKDLLPSKILERTSKANFTNTKIDAQFADFVRQHGREKLARLCDMDGLKVLLDVDFTTPEGDYWAWEIWGLYASAAFLYQDKRVGEINPASGVQQDRK